MSIELPEGDPTIDLPFAFGGPPATGRLRAAPEDFQVDEVLGYEASGDGEHEFLKIRKRNRNTHDVARTIARHAGVSQVAVGYAGLKDRNAVTCQSFTVQLPGREAPDWHELEDDTLQILSAERHNRKIRRGSLRGNRFSIRVSDIGGDAAEIERRLDAIAKSGVPNYFGSQRFGRNGQNLPRVDQLFAGQGKRPGREQRGLLLSAARAQLFNRVLAARVAGNNWSDAIAGDVMMLAGSQRQFAYDPTDETIAQRLAILDVHASGPLCGRASRALSAGAQAAACEAGALNGWDAWIEGLSRMGVDADRRALRLAVQDLSWQWEDEQALRVEFKLVAGAYATSVLREIVAGMPDH